MGGWRRGGKLIECGSRGGGGRGEEAFSCDSWSCLKKGRKLQLYVALRRYCSCRGVEVEAPGFCLHLEIT